MEIAALSRNFYNKGALSVTDCSFPFPKEVSTSDEMRCPLLLRQWPREILLTCHWPCTEAMGHDYREVISIKCLCERFKTQTGKGGAGILSSFFM